MQAQVQPQLTLTWSAGPREAFQSRLRLGEDICVFITPCHSVTSRPGKALRSWMRWLSLAEAISEDMDS